MMNKVYDFSELEKIRIRQRKLILCYAISVVCFLSAIFVFCTFINNNVILTTVFAVTLLVFILFSICFFKISYSIPETYRSFLDDLDTGRKEECVGVFEKKTDAIDNGEWFDYYIFSSSEGEVSFLALKQSSVSFVEGEKYLISYVGKYLYEWKRID